jgi:hypothetical protein
MGQTELHHAESFESTLLCVADPNGEACDRNHPNKRSRMQAKGGFSQKVPCSHFSYLCVSTVSPFLFQSIATIRANDHACMQKKSSVRQYRVPVSMFFRSDSTVSPFLCSIECAIGRGAGVPHDQRNVCVFLRATERDRPRSTGRTGHRHHISAIDRRKGFRGRMPLRRRGDVRQSWWSWLRGRRSSIFDSVLSEWRRPSFRLMFETGPPIR